LGAFANIIEAGNHLFTFHRTLVMKTFISAVAKFNEIETKVMQRNLINKQLTAEKQP
jgi:hypothetical protein